MKNNWTKVASIIKKNGIAIIPTDTLYGVVGNACSKKVVDRIYQLKGRDKSKPCIILISSFNDLNKFGIKLSIEQKELLKSVWPGKISVVLPSTTIKFRYLDRGTKTIAFRMVGPRNKNLYKLLNEVGPLAAPSANPQGQSPATNIYEAKKYFGDKVDVYIRGSIRNSLPSTLIKYQNNKIVVLRKGAVNIK